MALRVLFIGEIVGRAGIFCVKSLLPSLRKELRPDFVIANADGATGGFGIGKNHSIYLRKLGIDVLTSGDQVYFKKDMVQHIERAPYILRPANFPPTNPGRGWRYFNVKLSDDDKATDQREPESSSVATAKVDAAAGQEIGVQIENDETAKEPAVHRRREPIPGTETIAVISFLGQSGFNRTHLSNPFTYLPELVSRIRRETPIIILDFHAVTTAEKSSMFFHADGQVSAVIGTGTRVITADADILPGGTAVISDAGRTGSIDSVSGLDPEVEIQKYLSQIPERSKDTWGNLELQGVLIDLDSDGKATHIEAFRRKCSASPESEQNRRNSHDGKGDSNGG